MNSRHIPNLLTFSRLLLALVGFWWLAQLVESGGQAGTMEAAALASFWFLLFAVVTDFLDGYIARKYGWVSSIGRIADPVVDKVLILGIMVYLVACPFLGLPADLHPIMPIWFVILVLTREFLVTALRGLVESHGLEFPADPVGKWKMILQSIYVLTLIGVPAGVPDLIFLPFLKHLRDPWPIAFLVASVVVLTIWSGCHYCFRGVRLLRAKS